MGWHDWLIAIDLVIALAALFGAAVLYHRDVHRATYWLVFAVWASMTAHMMVLASAKVESAGTVGQQAHTATVEGQPQQ